MCPDSQILSVYLDGELPSPWKEKVESHLTQCSQCRKRFESYRLISASVGANNEPASMETAKERVWLKLTERRHYDNRFIRAARGISVWRRSISIPLPAAAAAAAVLFITMAALWVRRPAESVVIPQMAFASEENLEAPDIIPIADMNGVIRYLENKDNEDVLILHLPESRSFMTSGEPVILKAADYRRQP
jgi:anti-sigma factor RsiW